MLSPFSEADIGAKLKTLDQRLLDVLSSEQTVATLQNIADKYGYRKDREKSRAVSKLIALYVLGLVQPAVFVSELKDIVQDDSRAKSLLEDLRFQLLVPHRPALSLNNISPDQLAWIPTGTSAAVPPNAASSPPPPPVAAAQPSPPQPAAQVAVKPPEPKIEIPTPPAAPPPPVAPPPPKPASPSPPEPQKPSPEFPIKEIHYQPTKQIEEVPKIIKPITDDRPFDYAQGKQPTTKLPEPGKEIIDLSAMRTMRINPPASLAPKETPPPVSPVGGPALSNVEGPKAKGNALDLR